VCVFFVCLGGGDNFCHKKLPEAEVGELRGTNLRTGEGKMCGIEGSQSDGY
jgi:hypothetical protein